VVTLPMKAIQFGSDNKPYVLKKGTNEKDAAIKTEITTGINDGATVEVKSGVLSGETILYTSAVKAASAGLIGARGNANSAGAGGGAN